MHTCKLAATTCLANWAFRRHDIIFARTIVDETVYMHVIVYDHVTQSEFQSQPRSQWESLCRPTTAVHHHAGWYVRHAVARTISQIMAGTLQRYSKVLMEHILTTQARRTLPRVRRTSPRRWCRRVTRVSSACARCARRRLSTAPRRCVFRATRNTRARAPLMRSALTLLRRSSSRLTRRAR